MRNRLQRILPNVVQLTISLQIYSEFIFILRYSLPKIKYLDVTFHRKRLLIPIIDKDNIRHINVQFLKCLKLFSRLSPCKIRLELANGTRWETLLSRYLPNLSDFQFTILNRPSMLFSINDVLEKFRSIYWLDKRWIVSYYIDRQPNAWPFNFYINDDVLILYTMPYDGGNDSYELNNNYFLNRINTSSYTNQKMIYWNINLAIIAVQSILNMTPLFQNLQYCHFQIFKQIDVKKMGATTVNRPILFKPHTIKFKFHADIDTLHRKVVCEYILAAATYLHTLSIDFDVLESLLINSMYRIHDIQHLELRQLGEFDFSKTTRLIELMKSLSS
ncbi:unnamed protein product [Didymodactylos carnosus]|uniref:Uncharacterized protein n=1 Tax=Didymodactylos carnosus TaxID=1234261 RepID=A0A815FT47_9BILA|nr:unnamed protein product [Didymodactylos carnosus]CAF4183891.1 unnamed protein product [Didymodactylos carnosus]